MAYKIFLKMWFFSSLIETGLLCKKTENKNTNDFNTREIIINDTVCYVVVHAVVQLISLK